MSLLRSYSYYNKQIDVSLVNDVMQILNKTTSTYGYYIQGLECKTAEERKQVIEMIKQNTLIHVLEKYTPSKGALRNYVNAIQKNILKKPHNTVDIDKFLEVIDSRVSGFEADGVDLQDVSKSISSFKHKSDFEEDLLNQLCAEEELNYEIEKLALEEPLSFIYLCDALLSKDTTTKNKYQKEFMVRVLNLSRQYKDFNDTAISFFLKNGDSIIQFMALEEQFDGCWKSFSQDIIDKSKSKRLFMVDKNCKLKPNLDPDLEPFNILGNSVLKGKENRQILKVNYIDLLEQIDEMYRVQNSPLKLCFGKNYILRTLAGSYSILNVKISEWVEVQRAEIITNVLLHLDAKLLGVGIENIYLLSKPHYKDCTLNFSRYTIPIVLKPEVITEKVRFV